MAANQEATRKWWDESRAKFELFISQLVIGEISNGDPEAVKRRIAVMENLPELALTDKAEALAAKLLVGAALPQKAKADALHIGIATVHGMDYLLTWKQLHAHRQCDHAAKDRIDLPSGGIRAARDLYTA